MKIDPGPARGQNQKNESTLYLQHRHLSVLRVRPHAIPINDMVCANPACRGARFRTRSAAYFEHIEKGCRVVIDV